PRKKRIVPFGLISAAAVVLIMFVAYRGGPLGMFTNSSGASPNAESFASRDYPGEILAAPDGNFGGEPKRAEGGGAETKEGGYQYMQDAADEAAPAPAAEAEAEADSGIISDVSFWEANLDLAVEWLYRINLGEGGDVGDILKDIEIYRADPEGRFYVAGLGYKNKLEENMSGAGISAEADSAYNPNAGAADEKYIAILCYY
ncbi:MAG: hypothetical protein FWD23_02600, partial [Oscillospiraceae bacterium]|nr:hypothetical protein [Oscillospiraceae bacterium]